MEILRKQITRSQLREMADRMFGNMVKAVVDVERECIAVDAELHSDQEALLLEDGSRQENVWGINLYPEFDPVDSRFLEFDSMINFRPWRNNRSRSVDDPSIREKIEGIVRKWIA